MCTTSLIFHFSRNGLPRWYHIPVRWTIRERRKCPRNKTWKFISGTCEFRHPSEIDLGRHTFSAATFYRAILILSFSTSIILDWVMHIFVPAISSTHDSFAFMINVLDPSKLLYIKSWMRIKVLLRLFRFTVSKYCFELKRLVQNWSKNAFYGPMKLRIHNIRKKQKHFGLTFKRCSRNAEFILDSNKIWTHPQNRWNYYYRIAWLNCHRKDVKNTIRLHIALRKVCSKWLPIGHQERVSDYQRSSFLLKFSKAKWLILQNLKLSRLARFVAILGFVVDFPTMRKFSIEYQDREKAFSDEKKSHIFADYLALQMFGP